MAKMKSSGDEIPGNFGNFVKYVPAQICYVFIFMFAILFRWAVSVGPHSGESKPPMFGDFEAQRHWMEITYNLHPKDWYFNTTANDLQYWGLDYPPLTAYHSWLMGFAASKINSSWVALHESRGLETYNHKLFMRYTVLVSDCFIFIPAVFLFVLHFQGKNLRVQCSFLITWLMYPAYLLIDHGHFQYNCISLGLFLLAFCAFFARKDLVGSIFFCLALNYKQMELYHALPIFCYLFGTCFQSTMLIGTVKFFKLGLIVVCCFALIWFPFLSSIGSISQVVHRIFPVARGIYEDKVANVWCSLSVFIKWKSIFTQNQIALLSAFTTLICLMPSLVMQLWTPTKQSLKYSLIVSSLVFFLFSFQVHEKSILLASVPVLLTLNEEPFACCWFLLTSVVSIFPLIVKDEMEIAFIALFVAYFVWTVDFIKINSNKLNKVVIIFYAHCAFGLLLCLLSMIVPPPQRFPDLFPLIVSSFSCFSFACFLLFYYFKQYVIFMSSRKKDLLKKGN